MAAAEAAADVVVAAVPEALYIKPIRFGMIVTTMPVSVGAGKTLPVEPEINFGQGTDGSDTVFVNPLEPS